MVSYHGKQLPDYGYTQSFMIVEEQEDDFPIKTVKLSELPEIVGGNGYAIIQALDPMIVED